MRIRKFAVGIAALGLAGLGLAQGPRGRSGQGFAPGPAAVRQAGLDISKASPVSGVVTAVNIAYGTQFPSVELDKKIIVKVAPVWFLIGNDFEIRAGDTLKMLAAPPMADDAYLHAIEIENLTSARKIVLRDAQGLPAWGARRGTGAQGRGQGQGAEGAFHPGAGCVDPASVTTVTGVIDRIAAGAGIEAPYVIVKTASVLVTVRIGPERILLENDFELNTGEQVTIEAARCTLRDELIALAITNAAGVEVVLRAPDGRPVW